MRLFIGEGKVGPEVEYTDGVVYFESPWNNMQLDLDLMYSVLPNDRFLDWVANSIVCVVMEDVRKRK